MAVTLDVPAFTAVNEGTLPLPLAGKPIFVLLLTHEKVAPAGALVRAVAATVAPAHTVTFAGAVTVGVG